MAWYRVIIWNVFEKKQEGIREQKEPGLAPITYFLNKAASSKGAWQIAGIYVESLADDDPRVKAQQVLSAEPRVSGKYRRTYKKTSGPDWGETKRKEMGDGVDFLPGE